MCLNWQQNKLLPCDGHTCFSHCSSFLSAPQTDSFRRKIQRTHKEKKRKQGLPRESFFWPRSISCHILPQTNQTGSERLPSPLRSGLSFTRQELQLSPDVSDSTSFTRRRSQPRHLMWQPFLRRALITLTPEEARRTYLCGRRQLSSGVIWRKASGDGDEWPIGTLWASCSITSIPLTKRLLASNEFISLTLWSGDWSLQGAPPPLAPRPPLPHRPPPPTPPPQQIPFA